MQLVIPNWHPIAIYFAIGMLLTATLLLLITSAVRDMSWAPNATLVARWNLAMGVLAAAAALATGYYAFSTVRHDDPSHANMVVHLRWAFGTTAAYSVVALLAWLDRRRRAGAHIALAGLSFIAAAFLIVTAWYGARNTYEFGLGVQALPDLEHHHHGEHAHAD